VRKDFGDLQVANIDHEDKLGQYRLTKPNTQSLTSDPIVDAAIAAAREQLLTFTVFQEMASEKQPGIWLDQNARLYPGLRTFFRLFNLNRGKVPGNERKMTIHYLG